MSDLHLRDARAGDGNAIQEVTLAAYSVYASIMGPMWEFYKQSILETLADITPAEQIVAERDGSVVGTALLFPPGTILHGPGGESATLVWPEMRLLAVAPAAQGLGIGAALVRECIRRAQKSGVAVLTLHTTEAMRVAMAMYERMGFHHAPELDFHPAPNLTVKGYRLDLNALT